MQNLPEPVVVDKNGAQPSVSEREFMFSGWQRLLDGEPKIIQPSTLVSYEIAENGTITIVALCETIYIGPF